MVLLQTAVLHSAYGLSKVDVDVRVFILFYERLAEESLNVAGHAAYMEFMRSAGSGNPDFELKVVEGAELFGLLIELVVVANVLLVFFEPSHNIILMANSLLRCLNLQPQYALHCN